MLKQNRTVTEYEKRSRITSLNCSRDQDVERAVNEVAEAFDSSACSLL